MEEATGNKVSLVKSVSVEEPSSVSSPASDQTGKTDQMDDSPNLMKDVTGTEQRVDEKSPVSPSPSYLSMKSAQSMGITAHFREHDITEENKVKLVRSGSPTTSIVSLQSDLPMNIPITCKDEGSTEISREGLCDPCSDDDTERRAVKTCLTCGLSYCEKHVRRHYTSPRFQTHILVDVAPAIQQRLCQHHHRPLEVFSCSDNMLIPSQCSVTQHRGHDVISKAEQAAGNEHQRNTGNAVPGPKDLTVERQYSSLSLRWTKPPGLQLSHQYLITYSCPGSEPLAVNTELCCRTLTDLQPGTQYTVDVSTVLITGEQSEAVSKTIFTRVPPPADLTTEQVQPSSVTLRWTKAGGMETIPHHFLITYSSPGSESQTTQTADCCTTLTDLLAGTHYTVGVSTVLDHGGEHSEPASTTIITGKNSREKTTRCMNLLQKLDLSDMFPKLMQQRDVLVIDALSQNVKPPQTEKELSSQYLYKLMMLDYRARFLSCKPKPTASVSESRFAVAEYENEDIFNWEETIQEVHIEEQHIHPMDIHMAVFHCADDFLRQYIFSKLSSCQFGLPLLVPNPFTQETEFPLWALRNIKKSWQSKSKTDSPGKYQSRHMFNTPVPVVSFIRLGESSISKSQILNSVISKQKHNVFFHRHCKGSTRDCLLMDGVVEIAWYCPAGKEDDVFDDCVAFLNLHGDARDHPQQLEFMQSVSTVNVVLLSEHPLDEENNKIFKNLSYSPVPLIVLFTGQEKCQTSKKPTKVRLAAKNRNEAELNKEIISHIQHCVNMYGKETSIELFCDKARKHKFKVDKDKESCRDGREQAEGLMSLLRKERSSSLKEKLLPLQGKLWHDWCQKDKNQYRLKCKGTESLESQLEAIMNEKAAIRKAQLEAASSTNEFMKSFINCLTSPHHSQETKSYMLQWLRMFLDEFNMDALAGYEEEYRSTWETCGPKVKGGSTDKDLLLKKLSTISDNMTASTIGLQHIMRETSQMYEVFKPTKPQKETCELIEALPAIGAEMLMSGLPLELMDGDAAHVPLFWIQAVLDRLTETLGDKKVFVLSVLGLQSSGKSTLLNAMFGLQFTVSAGRCTRGAFMQLIKVDPALVDQLKYEYVLVVDTEGLRSPELSTNTSLSHDNELATFIIGIGDITIINIMGENPSEMHDILQICVQAFLRMKQVQITPSCIFVHQNVAEASAGEKNMEGRINLLGKLDAMAVTAAKEEQIDSVTGFSDIIQFDVKTHVFYFKGLLEGDPPMAPPNPSYSQNVQELKNKVLSIAQWKSGCRFSTLSEVKDRIKDLWNGLLKENFVFSFRNTLEMMIYSDLEKMVSEWSWKLRKHAMEKENEFLNQLHSKIIEYVNHTDLIVDFDQVYNPLKEKIETYFKENKNPEILIQWKVTVDKRLENLNSELIQNILKKCKDVITMMKSRSELDHRNSDYEAQLLEISKNLASELKDQRLTDQDVEKQFDSIWTDWSTKVANENPPKKLVNVLAAVEAVLQLKFQYQNDVTDKIRGKKSKTWLGLVLTACKEFFTRNADCINQCTEHVTNTVKTYITGKESEGRDFNDIFIHEMISIITNEMNNYPEAKLPKEYLTDLSVHLCIKAVPTFERMHSLFRKTVDPLTYLQSKRDQYLQMCKNLCKGANSITIFADFLCKQLEPAIKQQINQKTSRQISDSLKCNHPAFNGNRSNLENHILEHLAKKQSFEDFVEYINQPKTYFERFIQEHVETFCTNDKMTDMLIENLGSLKSVILTVNTEVTAEVVRQRGNAKTWLESFCKKLGTHMVIKREDLKSIEKEDIQNLKELKDMMVTCLNEMVMKMEKQEKLNSGKESFATLKKQATMHLSDQFKGCWAQCPFCSAICTNTIPNHDGDHSLTFHRCEAICGSYYRNTDHFSIDFCNTSVSSDATFRTETGVWQYKNYRDAGKPYNEWSITADASNLKYWKWFICTFQSQWEKRIGKTFAGKGEIPQGWSQITLESALEELKHMSQ
ncbi:interferon-induced very large GTPase 1-like isoform X2 [Osmerus eperlanus]|uniref:interferon-induced very large GTPase 1-like isoform X2 n=1 Tax=Osmerus eperlanus TaxID=29151 RepID=UPI002E10C75C